MYFTTLESYHNGRNTLLNIPRDLEVSVLNSWPAADFLKYIHFYRVNSGNGTLNGQLCHLKANRTHKLNVNKLEKYAVTLNNLTTSNKAWQSLVIVTLHRFTYVF